MGCTSSSGVLGSSVAVGQVPDGYAVDVRGVHSRKASNWLNQIGHFLTPRRFGYVVVVVEWNDQGEGDRTGRLVIPQLRMDEIVLRTEFAPHARGYSVHYDKDDIEPATLVTLGFVVGKVRGNKLTIHRLCVMFFDAEWDVRFLTPTDWFRYVDENIRPVSPLKAGPKIDHEDGAIRVFTFNHGMMIDVRGRVLKKGVVPYHVRKVEHKFSTSAVLVVADVSHRGDILISFDEFHASADSSASESRDLGSNHWRFAHLQDIRIQPGDERVFTTFSNPHEQMLVFNRLTLVLFDESWPLQSAPRPADEWFRWIDDQLALPSATCIEQCPAELWSRPQDRYDYLQRIEDA